MSPTIGNQVKLVSVAIAAGLAWTVFGTGTALADNPHFIFARCSLQQDGDVTLSFKEAGLGDNQTINYLAEGDVEATFVCLKRRSTCPQPSLPARTGRSISR